MALCIVTVLWIPVVKAAQGGQLFTYIVVVEGFIAAPLPILFLFAVFWDRCTEKVIYSKILIVGNCVTKIYINYGMINPAK